MIVYLFQLILELFALNNVTLFLCRMWPAAKLLLRKETNTELARRKTMFYMQYVGTSAGVLAKTALCGSRDRFPLLVAGRERPG